MNHAIDAVLFDLDGTLVDTGPDLFFAMSQTLNDFNSKPVSFETFRKTIATGSDNMVREAFKIDTTHPDFSLIKTHFLSLHEKNLVIDSKLYDGINDFLTHLENNKTPWGIVTNKNDRFTAPLLKELALDSRADCIVTASTLNIRKPDPAPLIHACQLIKTAPEKTLYIGDYRTDIIAAKAANMPSAAVTYGYYEDNENPHNWGADKTFDHPSELLTWFTTL